MVFASRLMPEHPTFHAQVSIIDRAALQAYSWQYLIIDEGQRIKNAQCRLVQELKKLPSENRLLLSGTPIQNTLEELWSLLNFVNPHIFDDLSVRRRFGELFPPSLRDAEFARVRSCTMDTPSHRRISTHHSPICQRRGAKKAFV